VLGRSMPFRSRLEGYYQRKAASLVYRRPFAINSNRPLISFTFDDFPRSALLAGGDILNRFGLAGTYYVSLGLASKETPSGQMFTLDDLTTVLEQGHELGCHTFSHCHSWDTKPAAFENSIIENRTALSRLLPGAEFRSFSYPICPPRPMTKAKAANYFLCCRGNTGQAGNTGTADLNQLLAYFLEKTRDDVAAAKHLIDRNREARGWLIFATHDVSDRPTQFGCTPKFFEDVVRYAVDSGALILPVVRALEILGASTVVNIVPSHVQCLGADL
jgi:peptidoglycan/xylan/chitin deacetylase (PgdA/CDA1 family)